MFRTEHLEGRLLYETDKVVCINIFVSSNYDQTTPFVGQVLLSLVNTSYFFFPLSIEYKNCALLTEENFSKEIEEGISEYLDIRKILGLN